MSSSVPAIPESFHSVTASLCVADAAKAIEFYKKAFGATERMRMPGPNGKIVHAEIVIGDSIVFLAEAFPEMPGGCVTPQEAKGVTGSVHLYVKDVDAAVAQAVKAGAKVMMPLADMFWGDRYGVVQDPFGQMWGLATQKELVTPEQSAQRMKAQFAGSKS